MSTKNTKQDQNQQPKYTILGTSSYTSHVIFCTPHVSRVFFISSYQNKYLQNVKTFTIFTAEYILNYKRSRVHLNPEHIVQCIATT